MMTIDCRVFIASALLGDVLFTSAARADGGSGSDLPLPKNAPWHKR